MSITRTGIHYPKAGFRVWRNDAVFQAKMHRHKRIETQCSAVVNYYAGDKRRRDVPAIMDAIWHVLERAGVVSDDCLITNVNWRSRYDKANPRVEIELVKDD